MASQIRQWLKDKIQDKGWSVRELARRADIAHTTVSRVMTGKLEPTWDFCAAIAGPLGESPIRLFILAGLLTNGNGNNETNYQALLQVARRMSPDQRREVLHFALFLLQQDQEGREGK